MLTNVKAERTKAERTKSRKDRNRMGTFIVLVILAAVVFFAARSIYRDKKAGKALCGGDCSKCKGCH